MIDLSPLSATYILFGSFGFLLILGIPIAFSLGLASMIIILLDSNLGLWTFFQRSLAGLNSFILIAVPLFIFTASLMNNTKTTDRLISFSQALIGHVRGGLAHVNIVVSMLFAGISGSSNADTAGIGAVLIPAMIKEGYTASFSVAVTACSAVMGAIIPPSILMVIWGSITNTSVAALFLGGIIPGILIGLTQILLVTILGFKRNFPKKSKFDFKELVYTSKSALLALGAPVFIIGGIMLGIFTPTESAIGAIIYLLFIELFIYRELNWPKFIDSCFYSSKLASVTLFCLLMSNIFSWLITYYQIPNIILANITIQRPELLLILSTIIFLIMGMFMDAIPVMMIIVPLLLPLIKTFGIEPIHFGVVSVMALTLGIVTPPYGMSLLIASKIGNINPIKALKDTGIFFIVLILVILVTIFFPKTVLFIPNYFL
jgi:TRAP-type transport system large permease protein